MHHGYKRDQFTDVLNLIIGDENLTEELEHPLYTDENQVIYMSKDDISNFFDNNIYYDENNNCLITTSNTKVASMKLEEKQITINASKVDILGCALKKDNVLYVPISELELVYNISIDKLPDSNKIIIDRMSKGMIIADVSEKTDLKYKPRSLSKNLGIAEEGEKVNCFYTTSKGWRLIRTSDGILGYVKANTLANECIIRQDMNNEINTKKIKADLTADIDINVNNQKVKVINNLFENSNIGILEVNQEILNNLGKNNTIWATISNQGLEKQSNILIKDYTTRTMLIDNIVNIAIKYNIKGFNINFNNIDDIESFNRFIIELTPKLREIGTYSNVILTSGLKETDYVGIADFVIEK